MCLPLLQVLLGCVFVFRIINVFSIHQCNPEPRLAALVAAEEVFLFAVTVMCCYFFSFFCGWSRLNTNINTTIEMTQT